MIPLTRIIRLILDLRRSGITDTDLLSAFERVPRENFVPEPFADKCYEDIALPIGYGQTVSRPSVIAAMLECLSLEAGHKVLEIGMGSGYQTAILTHLCRRVYSIERHKALLREAEERLYALGRNNFTCIVGDGSLGWEAQAPFPRIISAACTDEIPSKWTDQLDDGGIMVLPIGKERSEQKVVRVVRYGDNFDIDDIIKVQFVPLIHGPPNQ